MNTVHTSCGISLRSGEMIYGKPSFTNENEIGIPGLMIDGHRIESNSLKGKTNELSNEGLNLWTKDVVEFVLTEAQLQTAKKLPPHKEMPNLVSGQKLTGKVAIDLKSNKTVIDCQTFSVEVLDAKINVVSLY